jgi:hypothetical protein
VKHPFKEVFFPIHGDWTIEAYGWSKELARRLQTPFRVVRSALADSQSDVFNQRLLQADGYYIGHYHYPPLKTKVTSVPEEFSPQVINYLSACSGLAVVRLNPTLNAGFQDDFLNLTRHIVIAIPNPILKSEQVPEFISILRQVSILNMPFDSLQPISNTLLSRLKQRIQSLL